MILSIIIPTYNRKYILTKSINSLLNQKNINRKDYEIIIVDDGSTDSTGQTISRLKKNSPVHINYLKNSKNKGPAAARNLGINKSKGKLVLFLGDDIIATPNLLEEHIKWHTVKYKQENIAVLGYITWSKELNITPFMKFLEKGPQFAYFKIKDKAEVDYKYFYSSNLSLKKEFLFTYGLFDNRFPHAAWEDIELGYRLQKKGLNIYYNKNAVAYHYHPTSISDARLRMKLVGKSLKILHRIHPELKNIHPHPKKVSELEVLKLAIKSLPDRINITRNEYLSERYYNTSLNYHTYKGYF